MSQIIVIDSSDEGEESRSAETAGDKEINEQALELTGDPDTGQKLFLEFATLCKELVMEDAKGKKILKFLHKKHQEAPLEYKSSRPYRKLLQDCVSRIKKGSQDVYIHVHDVVSMLEKNNVAKDDSGRQKRPSDTSLDTNPQKQLRQDETDDRTNQDQKVVSNSENPVKTDEEASGSRSDNDRDHRRKTKRLELLLKRISSEIIRLQSAELSLDDLDKEDTSYIQESKLKRRFMQVYNELCRLNKCSRSTGRVIEKKIKVTASRFSEINRKVEHFINNPKRDSRFPDFADVYHLVKRANVKHKLHLSDSKLESTSRCIFEEVGESMQKRRVHDFVFEFGSTITDSIKDKSDPALTDESLSNKLKQNRRSACKNLDSVIEKYSSIQQDTQTSSLQENENSENEDDDESDEDSEIDIESITKNALSDSESSDKLSPHRKTEITRDHLENICKDGTHAT